MTNQQHGLGRIEQFDPRSLNFPIRALLTAGEQPRSYLWPCEVWLDQGAVGACVGFSCAAELAAEPVPVPGMTNAEGLRIYKAAQQLDPWPGDAYEGTSVLAGVKVLQAEGHISEYRWAFGLDDLVLALGHKGPAVLGLNWYANMYDLETPSSVSPTWIASCMRAVRPVSRWCGWPPPPPPPQPQPEPEPTPMTILDARNEVTNPRGLGATVKAQVIGIAVHHSVTQTPAELRRTGMADVAAEQAVAMATASTEASERAIIRAIDAYHVSVGYGGFAYHMAAFPSGRAYLCGDLGARRAHVAQRNHELLGVVLIGTFTTVLPGAKQMDALREALLHMRAEYPAREIRGHREWALPGEGTACPGVVVPRDWEAFLQEEEDEMKRFNAVAAGYENKAIAGDEWIDAQRVFSMPTQPRRVRIEVYLTSGELTVADGQTGAYAGRVGWGGQTYGVVEVETIDGWFGLLGNAVVAQLGIVAYS